MVQLQTNRSLCLRLISNMCASKDFTKIERSKHGTIEVLMCTQKWPCLAQTDLWCAVACWKFGCRVASSSEGMACGIYHIIGKIVQKIVIQLFNYPQQSTTIHNYPQLSTTIKKMMFDYPQLSDDLKSSDATSCSQAEIHPIFSGRIKNISRGKGPDFWGCSQGFRGVHMDLMGFYKGFFRDSQGLYRVCIVGYCGFYRIIGLIRNLWIL